MSVQNNGFDNRIGLEAICMKFVPLTTRLSHFVDTLIGLKNHLGFSVLTDIEMHAMHACIVIYHFTVDHFGS